MNYKKLTTWAKICKVHGHNPKALPIVDHLPEKFQNWLINTYKMGIITEAINTDENGVIWLPNYNDSNQRKYEALFWIKATKDKPSGVGFSVSTYANWHTGTFCGSRLVFESLDKLKHAQKYFENEFIEIHIIK